MKHSILKKTPSAYDFKSESNNLLNNVSSMSTSKIVRFSGIDNDNTQEVNKNIIELNNCETDLNDESDCKINENIDDQNVTADDDSTNDIKKYYKRSRALPFRQINLIGVNGEFIVAAPHFTQSSMFKCHPKSISRSKSMRIASAKNPHQQQTIEFRLSRQNTCPNISKTTPTATELKAPTPKYEQTNQTFYYWPSARQSPQHFMTTLPRSSFVSSQSNLNRLLHNGKLSSNSQVTTSQLLNTSPLAYKSTGSSIPLLNNRFLNTNLFLSSSYSPSTPLIKADKLINIDSSVATSQHSSISCSNIDSYSNQLMNSNNLSNRINSSSSLTLYTYLVQSPDAKNPKKDTKASFFRAQQQQNHQTKKNNDSNQINESKTSDVTQNLKSQKFSSLGSNLSSSLNRSTTTSLYSPLRFRTPSANTTLSTAIK